MIRNYFKIALRNISRYKLYSLLNIFGLAIGFTCFVLIYIWVQDEIGYDKFHTKWERIYRVEQEVFFEEFAGQWPLTSGAYGPTLINEYPEIQNYVRLFKSEQTVKDNKNQLHENLMYGTDNSIFDVFDFKLLEGNKKSALKDPYTIVLTREKALKYFGNDNIIGESIPIKWDDKFVDFKVVGILEEVPKNSHVNFDILYSISTILTYDPLDRFDGNYLYTYVLLKDGIDNEMIEPKLSRFMETYRKPAFAKFVPGDFHIDDVIKLRFKNIADIHLNPCNNWEIGPQGNKSSVYILSSVAFLIIIVACINFVNLSTAISRKRAKEVGLRKTLGAIKTQLLNQFLLESVIIAVFAFVISLVGISLLLPFFNNISGKLFTLYNIIGNGNIILLSTIVIFSGLAAGIYPSFILTSVNTSRILKGVYEAKKNKTSFRKSMVIAQFIISISLIVGTIIISEQMNYIQNKSLGFEKENAMLINVNSYDMANHYERFKNSVLQIPAVNKVCASSNIYGDDVYGDRSFNLDKADQEYLLTLMFIDDEYLDTYGVKLLAGRKFSKEYGTDSSGVMILNEAAVRKIGVSNKDIVGRKLNGHEIIGVVQNFNFRSLYHSVQPLVLVLDPKYMGAISLKLSQNISIQTLNLIEEKWNEVYAGIEFDFRFLDEKINQLYDNELRLNNIFLVFSILSIVIACLGLFGLSSFIAEERTKEIGIRKVFGASVKSIITLLIKDFSIWLIIANVIAWPIAYFVLSNWLQNFVYRIDLSITPFLLGSMSVFIIALITVSFQSLRAALANPVKSVKNE